MISLETTQMILPMEAILLLFKDTTQQQEIGMLRAKEMDNLTQQ